MPRIPFFTKGEVKDEDNLVEKDDKDKVDFSKDENVDRGNWTGKADFILACLGYAVGLGNVWRFPYLCYENGGAVFFIPYCIMLCFVGMPIFFLELCLGQFTSASPLTCWSVAPFFRGIGIGMVLLSCMVAIYYNVIIAWALWYMMASFVHIKGGLPWTTCEADYNTAYCDGRLANNVTAESCRAMGLNPAADGVCKNMSIANTTNEHVYAIYDRELAKENEISSILATEDYFYRRVLGKTPEFTLENLGPLRWDVVLCLLAVWLIVYFSLIKGVKSSGKVVYFTATFPYVILTILLVRGATLDGHKEGLSYYVIEANYTKLKDGAVWKAAASQIFFSLSASWGGLIALASYNRFHNDCLRDSLIVSLGNCLTSFYAGFVIFSFLGFLAKQSGKGMSEVTKSGFGLAFVVYPFAVTKMDVSELWSILFFFMLITLGLDSEFTLVETVTTSVFDVFPILRQKKALVLAVYCVVMFLLGLPICTNGGYHVLALIDDHAGSWNVLILAFMECLCLAWVYTFCGGHGWKRWKEDIRTMLGVDNSFWNWDMAFWWWAANWYFFTPAGVTFVFIFSWYQYHVNINKDGYEAPTALYTALSWLIALTVALPPFLWGGILVIIKLRNKEDPKDLFKPTKEWGPALVQHRKLILRYIPAEEFDVMPWGDTMPNRPGSGHNERTLLGKTGSSGRMGSIKSGDLEAAETSSAGKGSQGRKESAGQQSQGRKDSAGQQSQGRKDSAGQQSQGRRESVGSRKDSVQGRKESVQSRKDSVGKGSVGKGEASKSSLGQGSVASAGQGSVGGGSAGGGSVGGGSAGQGSVGKGSVGEGSVGKGTASKGSVQGSTGQGGGSKGSIGLESVGQASAGRISEEKDAEDKV